MRRIFALIFVALAAVVGCHGQIPPNPTTFTCPPSTGTAFVALNASSPASGLTYTDSTPTAGTYCYIAQSVNTGVTPEQVSVPSNTAGPITVPSGDGVALTWTAPTTGGPVTGYVLLRAPAASTTILAPTLGTGSVVAGLVKPALPQLRTGPELAKNSPLRLMAKLR